MQQTQPLKNFAILFQFTYKYRLLCYNNSNIILISLQKYWYYFLFLIFLEQLKKFKSLVKSCIRQNYNRKLLLSFTILYLESTFVVNLGLTQLRWSDSAKRSLLNYRRIDLNHTLAEMNLNFEFNFFFYYFVLIFIF